MLLHLKLYKTSSYMIQKSIPILHNILFQVQISNLNYFKVIYVTKLWTYQILTINSTGICKHFLTRQFRISNLTLPLLVWTLWHFLTSSTLEEYEKGILKNIINITDVNRLDIQIKKLIQYLNITLPQFL